MKAETIIDVVIKDKDGNDMPLKVKRLTQKRISERQSACHERQDRVVRRS